MSNVARRIVKNSLFQGIATGSRAVAAFVFPIILARLGGAALLGEYAFLITLLNLYAIVSTFGLPSLLTRDIARAKDDKEQVRFLIDSSLGMVLVLSILSIGLLIVSRLAFGVILKSYLVLILAGIALALESLARVISAAFRGSEELEWSSYVLVAMEFGFLVLASIIIIFNKSIQGVMTAYLISRILSLIVAILFYQPRFGNIRPKFDLKHWQTLLKTSFPFAVNKAFSEVYVRIDVIILAYMTSTTVVGVYETATSLTMRANLVAWVVNFAIYPLISSLYSKNDLRAKKYSSKTIHFLMIPGFFIAMIVSVFGKELTLLLYGNEFIGAVAAMKLLAFIVPLRFLSTTLSISLSASDRQDKAAIAVVICSILNIFLNFVLIPPYQMLGAVYSTIITEIVLAGLYIWYLRGEIGDLLNIQIFKGPGLGVAAVIISSLFFTSTNILISAGLFSLLYFIIVITVDYPNIRSFRTILEKK